MRVLGKIILIALLPLLPLGCARYPSTNSGSTAPARTIYTWIKVVGQINPTYYYFLALDTDGDTGTGPVPIVVGPELGNGWGTISPINPNGTITQPPFFVRYHDGQFMEYQNGIPIGPPYLYQVTTYDQVSGGTPSASSKYNVITLEINADDIVPAGTALPSIVQLNWITMQNLTIPPQNGETAKQYDGFGNSGNDYLDTVPLNANRSWESGVNGEPDELPHDSTYVDDIDMDHWFVEVRLNTSP